MPSREILRTPMPHKKNLAQKGYDLLVLLAISDKHYHSKEAAEISKFIKAHYHYKEFTATSLPDFHEMSEEARLEKIISVAESFETSNDNKKRMAQFAYEMIIADRKLAPEEIRRFKILERFWDFRLETLLKEEEA